MKGNGGGSVLQGTKSITGATAWSLETLSSHSESKTTCDGFVAFTFRPPKAGHGRAALSLSEISTSLPASQSSLSKEASYHSFC